MKFWSGYGSEHSMRLVMIGRFKDARDAEEAERLIAALTAQARRDSEDAEYRLNPEDRRFSEEMRKILDAAHLYIISPEELEQLKFGDSVRRNDNELVLNTDEADVSAYLKLFLERRAKIEVFSRHHYPESESSLESPSAPQPEFDAGSAQPTGTN
jgi:hypothetical protein